MNPTLSAEARSSSIFRTYLYFTSMYSSSKRTGNEPDNNASGRFNMVGIASAGVNGVARSSDTTKYVLIDALMYRRMLSYGAGLKVTTAAMANAAKAAYNFQPKVLRLIFNSLMRAIEAGALHEPYTPLRPRRLSLPSRVVRCRRSYARRLSKIQIFPLCFPYTSVIP